MRVAVTGSSGLIGSRLVDELRGHGHEVVRLVRRTPSAADEARWDPPTGYVDPGALDGVDASVHLAGAGLGDRRWTESYKRTVLESRTQGTDTIAQALAAVRPLPRVLVSGSAIGYYGDTGDREIDESSPRGDDFLAHVVDQWERAADPARDAGIRVVHPRTGLVVARGGTWGRLTPLFRLGLGGKLGDGRQYWSFVSLEDEVAAILRMLDDDSLEGPVDVTAPNPVTNAEMTSAMGTVLHRPTVFTVPPFALRLAVGEFSGAILGGQRVRPRKLEAAGFVFAHPTFESAYRTALADG